MAQLWIVAGPNGAGKTTIADHWLMHRLPVISPDALAANFGLSPVAAGRAAIHAQERLLQAHESFAIDTTFSGNREIRVLSRAKAAGYKTNLIFIGVASVAICEGRVLERVASGGHSVLPEDIARRYTRCLENLNMALPLADRIFILDNSGTRCRLMLSIEEGRVKHFSRDLPRWLVAVVPERYRRPARDHDR